MAAFLQDALFIVFVLVIASVKTAAGKGNDGLKPESKDSGSVKKFQWLAHLGIERSLMERPSAIPVFRMTAVPSLQKTTPTKTLSHNHNHKNHNHHRRVRRMLGQKNRCFTELKKFCRYFTHEGITDKFCLVVPAKRCTALD